MANLVSCPACARQLSINQELTAETLVQCPVCREIFTFSGNGYQVARRDEDGEDHSPDAGPQFSSNPVRPLGLEKPTSSDDADSPPDSEWADDADDDWPPKRKPGKNARNLLFAGFAVLILMILAIIHFSSSGSNPMVGSWRGTFQFTVGENVPCIYTFRRDGTMIDEHVDAAAGILVAANGSYTFANGKVDIRWGNGGFERATVRHTGPNTVEYVIQEHSDRKQIGGKATFVREGR